MSKKLVAYFSATGTTKKIAVNLAKEEGADLFEITPEKPYTADDLDWRNKKSRSNVEMGDPNCHPAVISKVEDMGQYDEVILGFPIWWGREPSIVDTFLKQYDFSGKTIVPFCTSGGSGLGHATVERINNLLGRKANVVEGRRFGGEVSIEDMKTWDRKGPFYIIKTKVFYFENDVYRNEFLARSIDNDDEYEDSEGRIWRLISHK